MLIKNLYARLGSSIIRGSLSIISSIFIVRTLGVDVIGRIAYYYGLVGMLTLFSNMGVGMAYRKFLTADDPDRQDIAGYLFLKLGLIALFCLIALIAYRFFYISSSMDNVLFLIAFVITFFDLISQIFTDTLSGRRKFIFLSQIEVIGSIILFLYNISVCLFFPSIYLLALNMVVIPLCFIIGGIHYCIRHSILSFKRPGKDILIKYFRFAYPIAFSSVIGIFTGHFEKVILGRLIGMKELGFYRLALGVFSGFDKVIKPVTNTLFTELSFRVNKFPDFIQTKFGDLVHTLNFVASLLVFLLIFASNSVVIIFYGSENLRTALILQFMALSIISRLFWRPYRHILYAVEAHHPLAYLSVLEFVLRLGFYYILIPLTVKGVFIGAIAFPLIEFILWLLPSGIYNVIMLKKRFGIIHIVSLISNIWIPFGLIILIPVILDLSFYLSPICLILFLFIEYKLKVLTRERWDMILSPLKSLIQYSS